MRGATLEQATLQPNADISIHAPHARSDSMQEPGKTEREFQSTLLMRGATTLDSDIAGRYKISIHAPHARSDYYGIC